MLFAQILAQDIEPLPSGGAGQIFFWVLGAGIILGLWFIVARSRRRSYNAYWERKRREEQRRLDDPDMAKPEVEKQTKDDRTEDDDASDP